MINDATHSSPLNVDTAKENFLQRVSERIEANLQNEQFGVQELARQMNISRSQLHRKLKQATNQSVNQLIREYRLKRARDIICNENKSISEVAFEVGFGSVSYFTTCFTAFYSQSPGEVRRTKVSEPKHKYSDTNLVLRYLKAKSTLYSFVGSLIILNILTAIYLQNKLNAEIRNQKANSKYKSISIAVLPFINLTREQEFEYYGRGIAEAINRHLSNFEMLKVVSLTSADLYKNGNKSTREIGNELMVSNLLEGSFQRSGNMIRLEVRLIDAVSEAQIWAENYDRELKDIFKTQTEIAEKVTLALVEILSPEEKMALNYDITDNVDAYDFYLKGIFENRIYSREGNHRATEYFRQAIGLDSTFALAYAGLAQSVISKAAFYGAEINALEALGLSKPFIDKSLELDPFLEEGHVWNGFYLLYNNWDFEGAEHEYKKAITGDNPDALAVYADFLNFTGRHNEAFAIAQQLNQDHPFYPNSRMVMSLYYLGRYEEAEAFARTRLSLFHNYYTLDSYGFLKLNTGDYPQAIRIFQDLLGLEGVRYPRILGWMGAAYAHWGYHDEAYRLIAELESVASQSNAGSPAFFIAVIHAALGDKNLALDFLHQAVEAHEMEIPWLLSEPQFFTLHKETTFQQLLNKVGFPEPI